MFSKNVPHRYSLLSVDGGPTGDGVALARLDRAASVELQVGNSSPDFFRRRAAIAEPGDPDHVATLLVVGIGIEEIVADVFECVLDLGAGQPRDIGFRIGDGGLRQYVFHRQGLVRQETRAPAKTWRQRDFRIELTAYPAADQLVPRSREIAAAIKQSVGGNDLAA